MYFQTKRVFHEIRMFQDNVHSVVQALGAKGYREFRKNAKFITKNAHFRGLFTLPIGR